jgi:hypothetical protein
MTAMNAGNKKARQKIRRTRPDDCQVFSFLGAFETTIQAM